MVPVYQCTRRHVPEDLILTLNAVSTISHVKIQFSVLYFFYMDPNTRSLRVFVWPVKHMHWKGFTFAT